MSKSLGRHDSGMRSSPTGAARGAAALLLAALLGGCASLAGGGAVREQASAAYAAGDYVRAAALYERAVAAPDAGADDWYRLGNAYAQSDRLVEATEAYRRALRLDPALGQARHNLGLTYLQLGVAEVLEARRGLPTVDAEAAATMRYLACIMEMFMGKPEPATCEEAAAAR